MLGVDIHKVKPFAKGTYEMDISGESFNNPDGKSRFKIIRDCEEGDLVHLELEDVKYHPWPAIKVVHDKGQLGYIPKEISRRLSENILIDSFIETRISRIYTFKIKTGELRVSCKLAVMVD